MDRLKRLVASNRFLVWITLFIGVIGSAVAQPQFRWKWSAPDPFGNNIVGLLYTNSTYVAVCDFGRIYTTPDLTNWTAFDSGTNLALRSVAYFSGQMVAVGESGTVVLSSDLANFRPLSLGTTDWLESVAASANQLVAVGDRGAIYTSANASNWTRRTVAFTNWLRGVTFGNGRFVAVGESGLVALSTNAVTWQKVASFTAQNLNKVVWWNNRYAACSDNGNVFFSANGTTWTSSNTGATGALYSVVAGPAVLMAGGDGELRAFNGVNWNTETGAQPGTKAPSWTYLSGVHNSREFVMAGRVGYVSIGSVSGSAYSWRTPGTGSRNWLWDMTRIAPFYIGVGEYGTILTSETGLNWEVEYVPGTATNSILLGVAGNTNQLVSVGSEGTILYSLNTLTNLVSTNLVVTNSITNSVVTTNQIGTLGLIWSAANSGVTNDLQGVACDGIQWRVAGDTGTMLASTNGIAWQRVTVPTAATLSGLAAFTGGWVAVGDLGTLLYSPDGNSWQSVATGRTNWIYKIRNLNGLLVAVGEGGILLTSTNGTSWSQSFVGSGTWLNDVTFAGGNYVVVGNQGAVYASSNLLNWTSVPIQTGKSLLAAASQGGQITVAGLEGAILRAQLVVPSEAIDIAKYELQPSTNLWNHLFLFEGKPDQIFTLESTTQLATPLWNPLGTFEITSSDGTLLYYLSRTNLDASELFRARHVP